LLTSLLVIIDGTHPKPKKHSYTRIIYDYARADVDALNECIRSHDWEFLQNLDIDLATTMFTDELCSMCHTNKSPLGHVMLFG